MTTFPHLFAPLDLRRVEVRNRILSTGHQTCLAEGGLPGDDLVAYHAARARGGAGLIVTEAARFHDSSISDAPDLTILSDDAIPHFARLAAAVKGQGARIFGQLSHAGRVTRRMRGGLRGEVFAPSAVAEHRFQTVPREMPAEMISELIAAAAAGATRYRAAGYDGVELMASHGLLFAQFLNPRVNLRQDQYGGSAENRMRALTEALAAVRAAVGDDMVVGLRISVGERERDGLDEDEALAVCRALAGAGLVDYLNVTVGSMAGLGGSIHVVPPMEVAPGYTAGAAAMVKTTVRVPVFVAGRINQPQLAERIIATGQADMCGMTRALIADPDMPEKARSGRAEAVRACIGCNQGCIGHFHRGLPISCIQRPETGREASLAAPGTARHSLRVLVAGGGPAGLKAAVTAAQAGHRVVLCEAGPVLGGQVMLAQALPGRAEFGGLITNLVAEAMALQVPVRLNCRVDAELIAEEAPDLVVVATGGIAVAPEVEGHASGDVMLAEEVILGTRRPGARVLVADWRCDWVGPGVAALLAAQGHSVRLAVEGTCAGQNLPQYVRDTWAGKLHEAGITVIPFATIYGVDADTAWLTHAASDLPITCEGVDSVVLCTGRRPDDGLLTALVARGIAHVAVGDCATGRTAEEAVYEGMVLTIAALDRLAKSPA
jgi:2,4-dienoyl-CoA reductase-like NADH-dependent reductase (Old Yellow Enzyme family)